MDISKLDLLGMTEDSPRYKEFVQKYSNVSSSDAVIKYLRIQARRILVCGLSEEEKDYLIMLPKARRDELKKMYIIDTDGYYVKNHSRLQEAMWEDGWGAPYYLSFDDYKCAHKSAPLRRWALYCFFKVLLTVEIMIKIFSKITGCWYACWYALARRKLTRRLAELGKEYLILQSKKPVCKCTLFDWLDSDGQEKNESDMHDLKSPEENEAEWAEYQAECDQYRAEQDQLDRAKYEAVQQWREESGSKKRFKGRSLREEYLAQLSDDKREGRLKRYDDDVWVSPDPIDVAMHSDGWIYPTIHEFR